MVATPRRGPWRQHHLRLRAYAMRLCPRPSRAVCFELRSTYARRRKRLYRSASLGWKGSNQGRMDQFAAVRNLRASSLLAHWAAPNFRTGLRLCPRSGYGHLQKICRSLGSCSPRNCALNQLLCERVPQPVAAHDVYVGTGGRARRTLSMGQDCSARFFRHSRSFDSASQVHPTGFSCPSLLRLSMLPRAHVCFPLVNRNRQLYLTRSKRRLYSPSLSTPSSQKPSKNSRKDSPETLWMLYPRYRIMMPQMFWRIVPSRHVICFTLLTDNKSDCCMRQHIDTFAGARKQHIFFGLLRVFCTFTVYSVLTAALMEAQSGSTWRCLSWSY
jgi:hypothetical protein